jgi:MFS family permease
MTIDAEPDSRPGPRPGLNEASVGQLASQLSEQVTRLVRDELSLAQLEAKQSAKKIGLGVGMFGAGGVFGFFAVGVLVAAAVLGLATTMSGWLAALIVAAALLVIAGIVALTGKKSLAAGTPAMPTEAIESTKADVAAVREAVKR